MDDDNVELQLNQWDPTNEPTPFACLVLASRRSGKSYLIKHLWQTVWKKKFDVVMLMCPTDFTGYYSSFLPGKLIFQEYNEEALQALMLLQKQRIDENKKPLRTLVILDDCSDDRERYSTLLQKLYTKGRHYNISVVFATQAASLSSTVWRNNSDFVLIGRMMGGVGREAIRDNFLSGMQDRDELPPSFQRGRGDKAFNNALMRKWTSGHSFLVISYTSDTQEFEDVVLQYKAP
jgi:hypothetical protein